MKKKADASGYLEEKPMTALDHSRDLPSGRPALSRGWIMISLALVAWIVVAGGAYLVFRGMFG